LGTVREAVDRITQDAEGRPKGRSKIKPATSPGFPWAPWQTIYHALKRKAIYFFDVFGLGLRPPSPGELGWKDGSGRTAPGGAAVEDGRRKIVWLRALAGRDRADAAGRRRTLQTGRDFGAIKKTVRRGGSCPAPTGRGGERGWATLLRFAWRKVRSTGDCGGQESEKS
jgi:hypothetical protein